MEVKVMNKINGRHNDDQDEKNASHSGRKEQKGNRDASVGRIWHETNRTGT